MTTPVNDRYEAEMDRNVSLMAIDQYRRDLQWSERPSHDQEQDFLRRARLGDKQARDEMILACYPLCGMFARRFASAYSWASPRIEYADLIQVGIERVLECFEKALTCESFFGFMHTSIRFALTGYCRRYCSLIVGVRQHSGEFLPTLPVDSLDVPLEENPDATLAEILPDVPKECSNEQDYVSLYEALDQLVLRQRDATVRRYGINCASEPYKDIASSWGVKVKNEAGYVSAYERRGLQSLRRILEPTYASA